MTTIQATPILQTTTMPTGNTSALLTADTKPYTNNRTKIRYVLLSIICTIILTSTWYRFWPGIFDAYTTVVHSREHINLSGATYSPVTYFTKKAEDIHSMYIDIESTDFVLNLPQSFGENTNVQRIWITHNPIRKIPDSIGNITSLQYLLIMNTHLQTLPASIANNTQLIDMALQGNQISHLPDAFSPLQKLKSLNLAYNNLTQLPPSIEQLSNLTFLDLTGNKLKTFPLHLPPSLKALYIGGNSIPLQELEAAQYKYALTNLIIFY